MLSVASLVDASTLRAIADARGYDDGLALADAGAVTFDLLEPMRVTATVAAPDGPAHVELMGGEGLVYRCDCTDAPQACRHVVAAAIALRRSAAQAQA